MTYPQGTAALAVEIAKAEIGTIEEGDNLTKYGEFTKANGLPWCGSFCNWVLAQAGVKVHSVVATAVGAHKFKEISRWSDVPAIGDLAFMDFPHDGVDRISHVGIVAAIDGKSVVTIEGNTSGSGDQRNGGTRARLCRGPSQLRADRRARRAHLPLRARPEADRRRRRAGVRDARLP